MIKNIEKYLKNNWELVVVIILSLLILWPLLKHGYFTHHDDLQIIRIHQMRRCFEDLQLPCRWVPDMGFGNGFPLFNYYPVLPYYVGGLLSYVFGYIGSAKTLFIIPLVLGGVSMMMLGRELFANKWAALVSSVLFVYAPYRALDTFVRGAVAESIAISIIPLIFYFGARLARSGKKVEFVGLTLSLAALLLSHNIMTIFFVPLIVIWLGIWLYLEKWKHLKEVIVSVVFGFGLSSFFILPAFFEKELVRVDTLTSGALDYRAHFVSVKQLFFDRFWGYGASNPGINDGLSFQVGLPLWVLSISSFVVLVNSYINRKKRRFMLSSFFFVVFLVSLLLMHNKSSIIWENISILKYAQFPWRFLSVAIFSGSILSGYLILLFKGKLRTVIAVVIVVVAVVMNWSYFRPEKFIDLTDNEKLTGAYWDEQRRSAILDYLPIDATEPSESAPDGPILVEGLSVIGKYKNSSNDWKFNVVVSEDSVIEVPVFDFPEWKVYVNNELFEHKVDDYTGRIQVSLREGEYTVEGRFTNTGLRVVANSLTLISLILLIYLTRDENYRNIHN